MINLNIETKETLSTEWKQIEKASKTWEGDKKGVSMPLVGMFFQSKEEYWSNFVKEANASIPLPLKNFVKKTGMKNNDVTAIDLACCHGLTSILLLRCNWKVIAVDYSKGVLESFEKSANQANKKWLEDKQLTIVQSKMETYQFPKNVQLIFAYDALCYCDPTQVKKVWDNIHTSLNTGGALIGTFHTEPKNSQISSMMKKTGLWYVKSIDTVISILKEKNYDIEYCNFRTDGNEKAAIEFVAIKK